jgi:hypothetical protein
MRLYARRGARIEFSKATL